MDPTTAFTITDTLVKPIQDAVNSGLTTLVPIGIAIMAAFIGLALIPKVLYRFF